MKRTLLSQILVAGLALCSTVVLAQRPEAFYARKATQTAGKGKAFTGKTNIILKSPMARTLSCPSCDTISFQSYTPDPSYISVYSTDSIWTHTYDALVPNTTTGFLDFKEGCLNFQHYADNSWGPRMYWDGFTVSKTTTNPCDIDCSDPCNGLESQFSSITGGGVKGPSDPYSIAYYGFNERYFPQNHCKVTLDAPNKVCGLYVTNNSYAYKSMTCGDYFAHKFVTGDSLLLVIEGYNSGFFTGQTSYYLANFTDPLDSYIIDEWKWINLTGLGTVDSLVFSLVTSDNGPHGPNTPMYFAIDEIKVGAPENCGACAATDNTHNAIENKAAAKKSLVLVQPNPATDVVQISGKKGAFLQVTDWAGNVKYAAVMEADKVSLSLAAYNSGVYTVNVISETENQKARFIKE